MSLSVGIVGLPNVGKSTLFNALLKRQAALAANYPFATIEPNVGIVEVKDARIEALAKVIESDEKLEQGKVPRKYATIEFVDIAGIVAGASKGEGLGNQFLANIRETDLICHVLRAFEDEDVVLTGKMDPKEDLYTIRMELILKDLDTVEKQEKTLKKERNPLVTAIYEKVLKVLSDGHMVSSQTWDEKEWEWLKTLHLLTAKPEIFVVNVSEEQIIKMNKTGSPMSANFVADPSMTMPPEDVIVISAKIEAELSALSEEDQLMYLADLGLKQSGIEQMAQVAYNKLKLISFLTAGTIECKAWTLKQGMTAQEASGVIHTDFAKKFIKAQIIGWQDFVDLEGWKKAKEQGKVRQEGRDYVMKDGEVVEFMIGK